MTKATWVFCPHCGAYVLLGTFGIIDVQDNAGGNFVTNCPSCGQFFDAAPQDGTYAPGADGRLQLIRMAAHLAASAPRAEVGALLEEMRAVKDGLRTVAEAKARTGDERLRSIWDLIPRTRQDAYAVVAILLAIFTVIQGMKALTADQVDQIVRHEIEQQHGAPPSSPAPPAPTAPSPPSSGPDSVQSGI